MKMPDKPTGNTPRVGFLRELWDYVYSLTPQKGTGIKFTHTSRGVTYSVESGRGGGGSNASGLQGYLAWFENADQIRDTSISFEESGSIVRGIGDLQIDAGYITLTNTESDLPTDPPTTQLNQSKIFFISSDAQASFQLYLNEEYDSIFLEKLPRNNRVIPDNTYANGLQYFKPVHIEVENIKQLAHTDSGMIFTTFDDTPFTFILPEFPVIGTFYCFALRANGVALTVQAQPGQAIKNGNNSGSAIASTVGGNYLQLFYLGLEEGLGGAGEGGDAGDGLWIVQIANGNWSLS